MALWLEVLRVVPGWVAVSLAVYDQTVGYHREEHKIPTRKFMEVTGLSRSMIPQAIRQAEAKGVVSVQRGVPGIGLSWSRKVPLYTMNPPEKWLPRTERIAYTDYATSLSNTAHATYTETEEANKPVLPRLGLAHTDHARSSPPSTIERDDIIDTIDTPIYSPIPPPTQSSTNPSSPEGTTTRENSFEREFSAPPLASQREDSETWVDRTGKSRMVLKVLLNGEASIGEICCATTLKVSDVRNHLLKLTRLGKVTNVARGRWRAV